MSHFSHRTEKGFIWGPNKNINLWPSGADMSWTTRQFLRVVFFPKCPRHSFCHKSYEQKVERSVYPIIPFPRQYFKSNKIFQQRIVTQCKSFRRDENFNIFRWGWDKWCWKQRKAFMFCRLITSLRLFWAFFQTNKQRNEMKWKIWKSESGSDTKMDAFVEWTPFFNDFSLLFSCSKNSYWSPGVLPLLWVW